METKIKKSKIGKKIVCIYHSIDLDGWMSAAIVKHWFNKQEVPNKQGEDCNTIAFIGYNYGEPIPDLSEYDKVIMCDITFKLTKGQEIDRIAPMFNLIDKFKSNFIWIDHHISAMNDVAKYANEYDYDVSYPIGIRDTKFAACELTWKYFFSNPIDKYGELEEQNPMPEIVRLLGRYDCFGHKWLESDEQRRNTLIKYKSNTIRWMSQEEQDELLQLDNKLAEEQKVLEFQYGARQVITNYEEAYNWLQDGILHSLTTINRIHNPGKAIYQYLCTEAKQTYKNGFKIKFNYIWDINPVNCIGSTVPVKLSFICINKERFNPINFGIDYHTDGYDGCACFWYNGKQWNFSLYNDNGLVDCSQIAKQYGGGGHKGAAGFVIDNINQIIK